MEYDPAVSTHKASSITSTTSTSSSSTWDHPTPTYIHHIKTENDKPSFEEFSFNSSLLVDRISIPSFDYAEDSNNFHFHDQSRHRKSTVLIDSFTTSTHPSVLSSNDTDNENSTLTNIRKENHEKITDSHHEEDQLNNIVTHDSGNAMIYGSTSTITLSSYGQQQPTPIYLQHGDQITVPSISMIHNNRKRSSSQSSNCNSNNIEPNSLQQPRPIRPYSSSSTASVSVTSDLQQHNKQRSDSFSVASPTGSTGCKRSKLNRDLLTDDEKRVNHIASEQKRRNTIRMGFKEMTEIIPTLKNINNSKSTILFKAVEYIKHLDKRNRLLREKITSLQMRMKVEGRMAEHQTNYYRNGNSTNTERYNKVFGVKHHHHYSSNNQSITSSAPVATANNFAHLPAHTVSALLAHKNQQRQLEELQEQLRVQQQLLAKHNIITPQPQQSKKQESNTATKEDAAFFRHQQQLQPETKDIAKSKEQHHYHSISIPSSRSSNCEENESQHAMSFPSTASFIVPQDPNEQSHTSIMLPNSTKRPWHHSNDD